MKRFSFTLSALLILFLFSFSTASLAGETDPWNGKTAFVEIELQDFEAESRIFYEGDYDVAGRDRSRSVVGLIVDYAGMQALVAKGYRPEIIADSNPARIDPDYFDYEDIMDHLAQVTADYPGIAAMVNLNDALSTPLTYEDRVVWAMKVSDNPGVNEDEPAVVIDGTHHARELVTPMAIIDIIDVLVAGYGTDPQITDWVDSYELWLIPAVNPDGLEYVFNANSNWRKNRKDNGGSYGVDDNRNYSFMWGLCGSTSSTPSSDTYRGAAPESEEEIQTMEALFAREKPLIYLSYHSYGNEVLYPYTCASLAERTLVYDIRDDYRAAMGYGSRTASASGESFEDAYNEHGAMSFLTEIGTSFQPSFSQVQGIVENLRDGWMYLLERGLGSSLVGHVTDTTSRAPLTSATIRVREIVFSEGEARNPEPLYGFFNRLLLAGDYTVDVGAPGYVPQTFNLVIGTSATHLDVVLEPGPCPDNDNDGHTFDLCGGDDCDDAEPAANPDMDEDCEDGIDNDCDGETDDDDSDCGGGGICFIGATL